MANPKIATTLSMAKVKEKLEEVPRKTLAQSKIQLPRFLSISYVQLEVFLVPSLVDNDEKEMLGLYQHDLHCLFIREGLSPQEEAHTVIHEVLHSIYRLYEVDSFDKEERIVAVVSNGLVDVIVRNPKLLDYLKHSLN